jgi:flavorubredoxin
MVALVDSPPGLQSPGRLTVQTAAIAPDTTVIRCLDWDRDRFDIEFELTKRYHLQLLYGAGGDQTALIDTSHGKFHELYLAELAQQVDLSHPRLLWSSTTPSRTIAALVKAVLQRAPQVTVVGSKVAIQFLQNHGAIAPLRP